MDSVEFAAYLAFIVSVFAVMNPMVAIPVYLSVVEGIPLEQRRRIPRKTATAAFVVMVIAFFLGEDHASKLLDFMSRVADGLVANLMV